MQSRGHAERSTATGSESSRAAVTFPETTPDPREGGSGQFFPFCKNDASQSAALQTEWQFYTASMQLDLWSLILMFHKATEAPIHESVYGAPELAGRVSSNNHLD